MRRYAKYLAIPLLLGALGASTHAASVSASLSTREAYVGNPIVLRFEVADAQSHNAPQIPSIDGVDVRSAGTPSQSSRVSVINGRRTERSSVTYAWQLIPRREGTFEIPPLSVTVEGKRQSTSPLHFAATKSETGDLLFAEIVGKEEQIFVGQPMELTLRIWLRPFSDSRLNVSLSEADMWQTISQNKSSWGMFSERLREMAEHDQRPAGEEVLRADANGVQRRYFLYEITATVYPKRPGRLDGDQVQVVVDYPTRLGKSRDPFESFFDQGFPSMFRDEMPSMFGPRLTVTESRPIVAGVAVNATDVMAIPTDGRPSDYRGAVGHYKIVSQATPNHVKAGDPITLHLGIQGDGPMDLVQAPSLSEIPALAADFKVAEDPLAGVVQDDVKLFTVSIRPRHEGVAQIPAIPFSYFDPDTQQFVTVHSDPIDITVDAADRLALDAIVGRAGGAPSDAAGETDSTPALNLTNFSDDQLLVSAVPASRWPLVLAILLPPLAWLTAFGYRHRDRLNQLRMVASGNNVKNTLRTLNNAGSASEVVNALMKFIANSTGQDETLSSNELIRELGARVSQETAARLNDVVRRCEQASYAGLGSASVAQLAKEAAQCLRQLNSELQAFSSDPKATRNWARLAVRRGKAATAVIALGSLFFFANTHASATELSTSQRSQILTEANTLYDQAQAVSATDTAEAKAAFSQAAQKYQTLVDQGVVNDRLYFNLGNAYLQSGSLGRAVANYECAIAVNPRSAAKANLTHARRLLKSDQTKENAPAPRQLWQSILAWNQQIPRAGLLAVGLSAWACVWLAASLVGLKRVLTRQLIVSASVVAVLCATSLVCQLSQDSGHDRAIVVVPQAQLREGNGETFNQVTTILHEGDSCDVIEQRDNWLKVAVEDSEGWLPSDSTVLLPTRN